MAFLSVHFQRKQICHLLFLWSHQPITLKAEQPETRWHSEIVMVDQIEEANFSSIKCSWHRLPLFVQMIHIQLIPVALDQDSFPCRLIAQRMSSDQSWEAWLSELCIRTANSTAGDTISSLQARRLISQLAIKCAHYNSKGKCPGIIQKKQKTKDFFLIYILWGSQHHNVQPETLWSNCLQATQALTHGCVSVYRPHLAPVVLHTILEWVVWFLEIN